MSDKKEGEKETVELLTFKSEGDKIKFNRWLAEKGLTIPVTIDINPRIQEEPPTKEEGETKKYKDCGLCKHAKDCGGYYQYIDDGLNAQCDEWEYDFEEEDTIKETGQRGVEKEQTMKDRYGEDWEQVWIRTDLACDICVFHETGQCRRDYETKRKLTNDFEQGHHGCCIQNYYKDKPQPTTSDQGGAEKKEGKKELKKEIFTYLYRKVSFQEVADAIGKSREEVADYLTELFLYKEPPTKKEGETEKKLIEESIRIDNRGIDIVDEYFTREKETGQKGAQAEKKRTFQCYLHNPENDRCMGLGEEVICPYSDTKLDIVVIKPYSCGWCLSMCLKPRQTTSDDKGRSPPSESECDIEETKRENEWTFDDYKNFFITVKCMYETGEMDRLYEAVGDMLEDTTEEKEE